MDITKAFDSINHQAMLDKLHVVGFPKEFTDLIANSLHGLQAQIWTFYGLLPAFSIHCGIHQGDPLSSFLFSLLVGHHLVVVACRAHHNLCFLPMPYHIAGDSEFSVPTHLEYTNDCTLIA